MSREKETMEQTATLEKEKENLARELASYINKEKDKVCYDQMFLARVGWVGGNFSGVVSQVIMPSDQCMCNFFWPESLLHISTRHKEKENGCYDQTFLARLGWVGGNFWGVVPQVIMPASHKFSIESSLFKSEPKWLRPGTNQVASLSFKMAQPIRKN